MKENLRYLRAIFTYAAVASIIGAFTGIFIGIYFLIRWIANYYGASPDMANAISWFVLILIVLCYGAVATVKDENESKEKELEQQKEQLTKETIKKETELKTKETQFLALQQEEQRALISAQEHLEEKEDALYKLINCERQTYPWLAQQIADLIFIFDKKKSDQLRTKSHPAVSAAEQVKKIAKEKRDLNVKLKMCEYQLDYYETLFPWLEEFKTVNPKDGARYLQLTGSEQGNEYDGLKNWLSPEEYANLSSAKRNQLALDRYKNRKKSDWEIGIEYERYVGYLYECKGYKVQYHGALLGLEDMGRDLIAENENTTLVIQCKRWSRTKTIHEKHIFQLYGSTVLMAIEAPKSYKSLFITTATLSDKAKKCASYLDVEYKEDFPMVDYPMIKCNIAGDGEKIYHLPFDQQYDKIQISRKKGAKYVSTAQEAEDYGFRHAYRWRPSNTDN
jgi:hypothetical protein